MPQSVNITVYSVSGVGGEVTGRADINLLYVFVKPNTLHFGAHTNTACCADQQLPLSSVHKVFWRALQDRSGPEFTYVPAL